MILPVIKFLPELISLIKVLIKLIREGKTDAEIREAFGNIEKAFTEKDPVKKSKALDDIFNKKIH